MLRGTGPTVSSWAAGTCHLKVWMAAGCHVPGISRAASTLTERGGAAAPGGLPAPASPPRSKFMLKWNYRGCHNGLEIADNSQKIGSQPSKERTEDPTGGDTRDKHTLPKGTTSLSRVFMRSLDLNLHPLVGQPWTVTMRNAEGRPVPFLAMPSPEGQGL